MDEISFQIRNIIVQESFSRIIAGSGIPVLDMAANTADLGKLVAAEFPRWWRIRPVIPEFYIENISCPRRRRGAGQAHLDGAGGRSGQVHAVFRRRGDDSPPPRTPRAGRGMGAGLGMGMGMAMANQMAPPWAAWPATGN
jgi:membrane protease subunit (stomatin/prohibitin family)